MPDLTWTYPIIKTWLHIFVGIAVVFIGYVCLGGAVSWARSIERQNKLIRKRNNQTPYQGNRNHQPR